MGIANATEGERERLCAEVEEAANTLTEGLADEDWSRLEQE
ncbi:hypothetical protein [Haloglycomyces albus]|nr:hypothetical protein [Haloglycomyces albus]